MRILLIALVALAVVPACKNRGLQKPEAPYPTGIQHPDIPAPPGFDYAPQRGNSSITSPDGSFRVVKQMLIGPKRDLAPTVKWYEEVFPEHGWTLDKKEKAPNGAINLHFSKGVELCHVVVHGLPGKDTTARVTVDRK